MTYFIIALTNDAAKLIVSESRTTDFALAEIMCAHLKAQGHIVKMRREG